MLRAKAARNQRGETKLALEDPVRHDDGRRDRDDSARRQRRQRERTASKPVRKLLDKTLGMHPDARLPTFDARTARRRLKHLDDGAATATPAGRTRGKVALFVTCYCNIVASAIGRGSRCGASSHNGIAVKLIEREVCCGMPKFELGDLDSVAKYKENEHSRARRRRARRLGHHGGDSIVRADVPPGTAADVSRTTTDVQLVKRHLFDPFEYLWQRHQAKLLKTIFANALGKVAWHAPCHQRVQNIGPKTRDVLALVPGTEVTTIERCSGHDGTYGVKTATYAIARKIARPVENRIQQARRIISRAIARWPLRILRTAWATSPRRRARSASCGCVRVDVPSLRAVRAVLPLRTPSGSGQD